MGIHYEHLCVPRRVCEHTRVVGGEDAEQRSAFLHDAELQSAVAVHAQLEALQHTHRHTWTQKSSVCSSEEQKNDTLTGEEVIYIPGLCESIDKKQTNHSES